ncbi:hypothetical protein JFK97_06555 [Chromobacterium phragmitis]|uniref:hypothetical protein n=1 Tax=Chromobacterium amazonense TaxID=1382803 RepID=UPI0021B8237A|nr:hypothetical protein [Chromobacterium amazonense]MBM2884047.1 hypothetical protein [Chromobacterium amazonense]
MSQSIEQLQAENTALRACALKYIAWLDIGPDPEQALEQDMRDPDMVGAELAGTLQRLSPANGQEGGAQ